MASLGHESGAGWGPPGLVPEDGGNASGIAQHRFECDLGGADENGVTAESGCHQFDLHLGLGHQPGAHLAGHDGSGCLEHISEEPS